MADQQIQIAAKVLNFLEHRPRSGERMLVTPGAADLDVARRSFPQMTVVPGMPEKGDKAFAILVEGSEEARMVGESAGVGLIISGDVHCVEQGLCSIAIETSPKISIAVSRSALARTGVRFDPNFKLLITEY